MMKKMVLVLSAITVLLNSPAASTQMSGPVLGYVVNSESFVMRAVKGIPGASALGKPLDLNINVRKAVVSVERDYALAVLADTGEVAIINNLSSNASVVGLSGLRAGGDALALTPDGSTAVMYNLQTSRIQVIGGLPSNPAVRFEIDTTSWAPQRVTAVAINRNQQVIAAFSDGENGTIYSFDSGVVRFIAKTGDVAGIAFTSTGKAAVVADRASNQVLFFQDLSTTAAPIQLANIADGISAPIGVLVSRDAKTAYVANAGSQTVTVVQLGGGAARKLTCDCDVNSMQALAGNAIFAVTDRTDHVVLFDGGSDEPRFVVVPPEERF
jgi:DNA-binding beta-propeller fold protein YncE